MVRSSSARRSMISWRCRAASRRSCRSRMACAWISSMSSSSIRPVRASSTSGERRISAITSSSASSALTRPRWTWARRSASARRKRVRRWMTSIWWATQLLMNWSIGQRARHAVDQGQHVRAEVGLQLGVLEQVVEHDAGDRVALEHDDQALAGAARGVVADVGDALDLAGVGELGDLQRQVVGVDHVGQLGDRQAGAALGVLVDLDDRALGDRAAAGAVGLLDALAADDQRAVGEVGALDPLDQGVLELLAGGVGVLERPAGAVGDLAQVVRRDVGGHADRDAGRAVDQQVGVAGGQDRRLLRAAVVVGLEVDGVLARCRAPSPGRAAPSGTRCTASRRRSRCRASRSCPGRGPAGRASPRAARAGPGCRRSRCRRAGGTDPSRHRRRASTSRSRGRAGSRRRTSRRAPAGAPA